MTYSTAEARQQLLDELAGAIDSLSVALAAVGAAYEQLDEHGADTLEESVFRPIQLAYGRAQRVHGEFAQRQGLPVRLFAVAAEPRASRGMSDLLGGAVEAVEDAEAALTELQDSMLPVDVGDAELRAGLASVRETLSDVSRATRNFLRRYGR